MKIRNKIVIVLCVILLCVVLIVAYIAAEKKRQHTMEKAAAAFYQTYLKLPDGGGLPSEKNQQKLKPYMTASLTKLLQQAGQADNNYGKNNRDVPGLVEGDPFSSSFEGASSFKVLSCSTKTSSCMVELTLVDTINKKYPPAVWKDKVDLVKENSSWLVNDIEFLGGWPFGHATGHLRDLLSWVVEHGDDRD